MIKKLTLTERKRLSQARAKNADLLKTIIIKSKLEDYTEITLSKAFLNLIKRTLGREFDINAQWEHILPGQMQSGDSWTYLPAQSPQQQQPLTSAVWQTTTTTTSNLTLSAADWSNGTYITTGTSPTAAFITNPKKLYTHLYKMKLTYTGTNERGIYKVIFDKDLENGTEYVFRYVNGDLFVSTSYKYDKTNIQDQI